jgi:hypothetical protein
MMIQNKPVRDKKFFKDLFERLYKPLTCGAIDSNGNRYQIKNGVRSSERIFILESELDEINPNILLREFYDKDSIAWKRAICFLIENRGPFTRPIATIFCLERGMTTSAKVNIEFDIDFAEL